MHVVGISPGPGRPPKRTPQTEADVLREWVRAAVCEEALPTDAHLGARCGLGERLVRQIRLDHGLSRWDIRKWREQRQEASRTDTPFVAYSPFAGVFLMLGVILSGVWRHTLRALKMPKQCTIAAHQFVLTLLLCSFLGIQRLFHLEHLRHPSDVGLALFVGRSRLPSDSTLWNIAARLTPQAIADFYTATACSQLMRLPEEQAASKVSFDEHVVPYFTRLAPLAKTRIPTRGRSMPAIRLYFIWDVQGSRFVGMIVTEAGKRLSQVILDLVEELRTLKRKAGIPNPHKVWIVFDRGGYKGTVFGALMADPHVQFLTKACNYAKSVRQWERIPEAAFRPFVIPAEAKLPVEEQTPLKVAHATTRVDGCPEPIPSWVIRDDRPDAPMRWQVFFYKQKTLLTPENAFDTYHLRQHHERAYRAFKGELGGDALPKPYRLIREANEQGQKRRTVGIESSQETLTGVQLIAWIKGLAHNLIREFGQELGPPYDRMMPGTLLRKFLRRPGRIVLTETRLHVEVEPFDEAEALKPWLDRIHNQRITIPWMGHRHLHITVAQQAMGSAEDHVKLKQVISANSNPAKAA